MAKDKTNKGPDAFQKELQKDFRWVIENRTVVFSVVTVIAVACLAYAGFDYYRMQQGEEAQALYYKAENAYLAKVDDTRQEAREGEEAPQAKKDIATLDLNQEIEGFKLVISEYPSSEAAVMAALQLSEVYEKKDQAKEAVDVLSKVSSSGGTDELLGALLIHRLGSLKAKTGDCEGAIESFKKIISTSALKYLHGEAQLKTGLCYEQLGKINEAKEAYKSASEQAPDQGAGQTATHYLRLLERQSGEG